jgi:photosystem II stability/assembly factor-like uncharacterized protein
MGRLFSSVFLIAAMAVTFGQDIQDKDRQLEILFGQSGSKDIKPWDKKAEREKFHPTVVRGTLAADRDAAYQKRLQLEKESFLMGYLWKNVGPEPQSGRVMMITAPENNPDQVYAAFATGGLFRTEDDGQTWTSLWDNQPSFGIGDFAVSKDGKTIYLGTGEANNQRTSYSGTGMYKSTDSGKTWSFIGLPESHHIGRIVMDPKDENTVWVAVTGHLYSANPERGLYKTTDGGKSWKQVLKKDEFTGAIDIQLDPKNPKVAVAAMYQRDRRAWNFLESGPGSAVYRTEDGGNSWKQISTLPSGESCGRVGLAWAKSDNKIVYAFVENPGKNEGWGDEDERTRSGVLTPRRFLKLDAKMFQEIEKPVLETFWKAYAPADAKLDDVLAGLKDGKMTMADVKAKIEVKSPNAFDPGQNADELYKSTDGGKTFAKVTKFGEIGGYYYERVFVNPKNSDDVWICGVPMLRSTDGGKNFKDGVTRDVHVDHHAVYFDQRNPNHVWVGNDGGIYLSRNDGKNWFHFENLSVGQTTTVAVDNKSPYNIYTGLQDNGTMRGPSDFLLGVTSPNKWEDIGGGDGSAIAIDPRPEFDLVYGASQFGAHYARDFKNNSSYSARPRGAAGEAQRANWISPIQLSTFNADIVYIGFNRLYRSFDRGRTFKPISPDLTRNRPNGDVPHSTIKDLSESPLKFGLIYCGGDDGRVTMTPDGGNTWIDIPTPQPEKWVSRIVASRHDENTVFCSQSGFREDDWSAYLWKSTDQGKTWKSIVGNLPHETINVVREDPKNKDILYVGTDLGVYVTFDGGTTWEVLGGALGHLPVHDMVIQEREYDLVVATHARGCWVLPLKPVMALTKEQRSADLTISSLSDMSRSVMWGYERRAPYTTEPSSIPTLKCSFFSKASGAGTIELVDKDGKVVLKRDQDVIRGLNNTSLELRLTKEGIIVGPPAAPKDAKEAVKDPFESKRATFVPIGSYKLRITIGGKSVEKDWKLD